MSLNIIILTLIIVSIMLVRGLFLYPLTIIRNGKEEALRKYHLSVLFVVMLTIYEVGNLTGFSWKHCKYISEAEIIDAAVRYSYHNLYFSLNDMQEDYSNFKPDVRYWGSWSIRVNNGLLEKLFGLTRFQVRMPEEIVMVTVDGKAIFSRPDDCIEGGECQTIIPDNPEQGFIGTVQLGAPNYEVSNDFSIEWNGENNTNLETWGDIRKDNILIFGHCFSAYIKSPKLYKLVVSPEGAPRKSIRPRYGFYLVAINSDGYKVRRISKAQFLKAKSCSKQVLASWPSMGGWWKR